MYKIEEIVIAGGGPVGAFTSVLMSSLGLPVTVYEKRESYTREINVKIDKHILSEAQRVCDMMEINDDFFYKLDANLEQKNRKILIKELEATFKQKAESLSAKYVTEEVKSFAQLYERHQANNPIIIDCTGRNSVLRMNEFGEDKDNIIDIPLESAMHINFRAKFETFGKTILYSAMKNNENIRLSEIVASRKKTDDGYKSVTIPVFISKHLANEFDARYPNINKKPLAPFKDVENIPDEIFQAISSIIGTLIMEDWAIDFESIVVKKIEITCGYSKTRSRHRYVCLGDSSVYLAFYKSLNFGLKHALDFFTYLTDYPGLVVSNKNQFTLSWSNLEVLEVFKKKHPGLNPVYVRQTVGRNSYLVVTKILFYGCYYFNLTTLRSEQLTGNMGINEADINNVLIELNRSLNEWGNLMEKFETKRLNELKEEIDSNQRKKRLFDYLSDLIWLNSKSPLKISETMSKISNGYALYEQDHEFIHKCLVILKDFYSLDKKYFSLSSDVLCSEIERLLGMYVERMFVSNKRKKMDLLGRLKDVFDHSNEVPFEEKVEKAQKILDGNKDLAETGSDVQFIFIIKCVDIIIDHILEQLYEQE